MDPIQVSALPPTPWKNGGGSTRTIAIFPPEAGFHDFDWRVSVADVESSGEFSRFPGVDRTILLLDGDGMILHFDNRSVALTTPYEPFAFSGDDRVRSELINGSTSDFNVMTRRGRAKADVKIVQSEVQLSADAAVFYCPRGAFHSVSAGLEAGWAFLVDRPVREMSFKPRTGGSVMMAALITMMGDSQ
jgi:environmental stress-induced protein Ves